MGDPTSLPYDRPDVPSVAPVALIGMDLLGRYDFCFYRNYKFLILWPPSETDAMFPEPKTQHKSHQASRKRH